MTHAEYLETKEIMREIQQRQDDLVAQVKGCTILVYHIGNSDRRTSYPRMNECDMYVGAHPEFRHWIAEYVIATGINSSFVLSDEQVAKLKEKGISFQVHDYDSNTWKPL